uniref:Uncharacterized protein n=1 Tax=Anopheles atroparvus TaxID=41427 RepID=A0A182ISA0_ANOAO
MFAITLLNEPTAAFSTLLALVRAAFTDALTAAMPAALYGTAALAASVALTPAAADSCSGILASTPAASARNVPIALTPSGPSAPSRVVAEPGLAVAFWMAWMAAARSAFRLAGSVPSAAATVPLPSAFAAALTAVLTAVATLFSAVIAVLPLATVGALVSKLPIVARFVLTPPSRLLSAFVMVATVELSNEPAALPMLVRAVLSALTVEVTTLFTRFSTGRFELTVAVPPNPMPPMLMPPVTVPPAESDPDVPCRNPEAMPFSSPATPPRVAPTRMLFACSKAVRTARTVVVSERSTVVATAIDPLSWISVDRWMLALTVLVVTVPPAASTAVTCLYSSSRLVVICVSESNSIVTAEVSALPFCVEVDVTTLATRAGAASRTVYADSMVALMLANMHDGAVWRWLAMTEMLRRTSFTVPVIELTSFTSESPDTLSDVMPSSLGT